MAIDPEKNNYEMPTDVADAIKDLQPSVRAKIEEVFKAYDAFEDLDSSIYKLECFLRDKKISGENGKYYKLYDLICKIRSIWKENNIGIEHKSHYWNKDSILLNDLIRITIVFSRYGREQYIEDENLRCQQSFTVEYNGHNTRRSERTNSSELRKEAAQICKLLMNEL